MIPVNTAKELVLSHASKSYKTVEVELSNSLGFILAEDVVSEIDMPPFRQSAMDGYAMNFFDGLRYSVVDEVKAGDTHNPKLNAGEAVRIFTGAPVPDTANTVIMQEKVDREADHIFIDTPINQEINIRSKGEQIKTGELALAKGTMIKGVHIGFLAGLGFTKITVYRKPSIAIIVTGNELITPGNRLSYGEIYESNSAMLQGVLLELGYKEVSIIKVADDYEVIKSTLANALLNHEILIVTGGISVGDYDFVGKALLAIGVKEVFYKVKQKPGKPLFFGKKNETSVFGLPGNPAAALSCFYIYIYPHLKKSEGAFDPHLPHILLPSLSKYTSKGNRVQFLKASVKENGVQILDGQSSAMIRTFGDANALVYVPERINEICVGQTVKTILLPF